MPFENLEGFFSVHKMFKQVSVKTETKPGFVFSSLFETLQIFNFTI